MTLDELFEIVNAITYKPGWSFNVITHGRDAFLQLEVAEPCEKREGLDAAWKGRKWYVSSHATRSEIVQTCLMAILAAEEHEARETFMFKGQPVFSPHWDVEVLASTQAADDTFWYDTRKAPSNA